MMAIPMLLFHGRLFDLVDTVYWGNLFMAVAVVLTVWSMFYYLKLAWPLIKEHSGKLP
jgi:cardiolipin synthase